MNKTIQNAKVAYLDNNINYNAKDIIREISYNILLNKNIIIEQNQKDIENDKGFKLDFEIIDKILKKSENVDNLYKKKTLKNQHKNVVEYDSIGVLETFFDGNTYVFIEMALKSINSHNSMIFVSQVEYMNNTNGVICEIIREVLKKQKLNAKLIQLVYNFNILEYCNSNYVIKKAFVVGNTDLHTAIKRVSKINTEYYGYCDCDIYIDCINDVNKLRDYIKKNCNVLFKIYVNNKLNINLEDAICVKNIEEAIDKIEFDSCSYCLLIFSNDSKCKAEMAERCKTKNIFINKFMDLNSVLDIDMNEFYIKKYIYL